MGGGGHQGGTDLGWGGGTRAPPPIVTPLVTTEISWAVWNMSCSVQARSEGNEDHQKMERNVHLYECDVTRILCF